MATSEAHLVVAPSRKFSPHQNYHPLQKYSASPPSDGETSIAASQQRIFKAAKMVKTGKANYASTSKRSRAARRADSPSLNLDKSITDLPRADADASTRPSFFNAQHDAGISKKTKARPMTRAQKQRVAKGLEKAEAVMARTENKVAKSEARAGRVQSRRAAWEDMNGQKRKLEVRDDVEPMDTSDQEDQPAPSAPETFAAVTPILALQETVEDDEDDEIT